MKTLFITVPESSVANNLLRGSFWKHLNANRDFRAVLIVPPIKSDSYQKEFGREDILVESLGPYRISFRDKLLAFLARNALKTKMVKFVQYRQYQNDGYYLLLIIKRLIWYVFGHSRLFQFLIRRAELTLRPNPAVKRLFDFYNPTAVFTTITNYAEIDIPVLREAKRRGITTIGMVRGWDAFVAHGVLRVVPDLMLLQNLYLYDTGMKYQFLSSSILKVIGFPLFDWYFTRKDLLEPREQFLRQLGIEPQKRVVLFGAMENYWYPRDAEIAEIFDELVEKGKLPQDLVMLFRPYPGYVNPMERVKNFRHVVPDWEVFTLGHADDLEIREKQIAHLMNSIFHSEVVVSVASTIAIDGVVFDKPAIAAIFEKTQRRFWESIRRFADHCTHFQDVMATGGVKKVEGSNEFAEAVKVYLDDPRTDEDKRSLLKKLFIEPYDGKVGERIAREIRKLMD